MQTDLKRSTVHWGLAATISLLAVACGDDGGGGAEAIATTAPDPAESAYCETAREWGIHELQPPDDSDPAAFRTYWEEYLAFTEAARAQAPEELGDAWQLKTEAEAELVTPVFEAHDYDLADLEANGTPEELAGLEPPAEVQAAQAAILTYEADVCGAQQPPPANVSFDGEEPGPYCDLVAAESERVSAVLGDGADPTALEALSDDLVEGGQAIVDAAPAVIADEAAALADWTAGPQRDVLERHDWDLLAVIREGPAQDRAILQQTDPAIRDQYATVAAYEEQVCGA